jgi:hypothetical protein
MDTSPPPTQESELLTGLYTDEEKSQILGQIEEAASANRLTVDTDAFRPRKRGILFPVMVNLAAVALIAGSWFGASAYFQTKQEGLKLRTDKLFSTESKLLTKVLEDSKNQLAQKDAEITKIQGDMAALAQEKADLLKNFATRLGDRERALRLELATTLAAERKRLEDAGYGPAEVERRLREFESRKTAEFNAQLAEYRRSAQAEIDQRSLAVTALQVRLRATAAEQEQLRKTIDAQTKEREQGLRSQLTAQATDLDQLKRERDELAALGRTTDPLVADVRSAFDAGDRPRTQASLQALRQSLAKAALSASDVVRARAQAQAALAASLDAALAALDAAPDPTAPDPKVESLRGQLRKEKELSAVQQAEALKIQGENSALKRAVADALAQLARRDADVQAAQANLASAQAQADVLNQKVAALAPYQAQVETLQSLFQRTYPSARERFQATFGSETGLAVFPNYPAAWQEIEDLVQGAGEATLVRRQAFQQVLSFTDYLRGTSLQGGAAKEAAEKLARSDETFRQVVDDIQALAQTGPLESPANTAKYALYGTVTGVTGAKIILERLTKVKLAVGQTVELRRVKGRQETVLGQATVVAATDKRVELKWDADAVPFSGDQAYLVLP